MSRLWFLSLSVLTALILLALVPGLLAADRAAVVPLPPPDPVDGRAGLCYTFYNDPERPYLPMAYDAGARWDRFDFTWPVIEPENDVWNFSGHETLVADLKAAGIDDVVGILLWTPDWASTSQIRGGEVPSIDQRPGAWYAPVLGAANTVLAPTAASAPPNGLYEDWDDPNNYWGNYVFNVVSHFGDDVKYWEMWNEPEWAFFWTGTDADYARLLTVGYQATKAACPDCQVLFGGLLYWADPGFYERVLDIVNDDADAAANNYYFDIMSVHLYSTSDHAYSIVNQIRSRMTLYVPDHPIWLTETGVPVWDDDTVDPWPDDYDWAATEQEAGAYVIQSYAGALASGVERYFLFRTNDNCPDPAYCEGYFGVIRDDETLRPAYVAYQVATGTLISPTFTTRVSINGVTRVTLWGSPHGKVSVVWNTAPAPATYTYGATMPTATRVDQWGVTETLTATGGVYTMTLPGATAFNEDENQNRTYFIGGAPSILIETETPNEPPTSTVHPLPAVTRMTSFTVTWEGADNASGVWLYDIQVRDGEDGEWTYWQHSTPGTSGEFAGELGHAYCFRSRAMDRLGNREAWPEEPEACTSLPIELDLAVGEVFGDDNRNGVRDGEEVTLTQVAFHLWDAAGLDVVTPTVGSSWAFTTTLSVGDYVLAVIPDGWFSPTVPWLPVFRPIVVPAESLHEVTIESLGLPPHVADVYLPIILQMGSLKEG